MKILILEDDQLLCKALKKALAEEEIQICHTLAQAWHESRNPWDVYIVDLGLPDGSGWEAVEYFKSCSNRPVIVITGNANEQEIEQGFHKGIYDYLVKPVTLAVLREKVRRIKAELTAQKTPICEGWYLDGPVLQGNETQISLTRIERALLQYLLCHENVSRCTLMQVVFDASGITISDNSLSVRLSSLRKKLQPLGITIHSVRYAGVSLQSLT